ncbi:MAG: NAD-dependent epimerase/dehydratase family protein [Solirubrobacterales bacterium]|nr:NAD-dependent epimerase/dehydratase family protein [Solirubrobacterales bacterium]
MEILLTGASGFVGSLLLDVLRREGHDVRALTRHPDRLSSSPAKVMRGDAVTGEGIERALEGVEVAYYLIHSMEASPGGVSFMERERIAAGNFAAAARAAGVRRIVYLGGLVPRWEQAGAQQLSRHARARRSRHLESREAVERILLDAVPDSLALRSSIVIGARSRSFRLLVRLVERLPVLALPAWQRYRTQPIDERDVIAMLAACASSEISGEVLEIGGPDVLSYGEMLERIAEAMLIGRPAVRLGVNLTPLAGRVAAAIAAEDPELVVPLMEGLQGDLLARDDRAAERLGVRLHSFDSAVEHALAEWERAEPLAAR